MPMGIVADDEFEAVLKDCNTPSDNKISIIKPMTPIGRSDNDVNVPDSLRKIIGESGNIDSRQDALEIGRAFGISPSSVSAYTNGATSTASYHDKKDSIVDHIETGKLKIAKKAKKIAKLSLDKLSEEDKLDGCKAVELAQIARQMTGIMSDMEPEQKGSVHNGPSFIFMVPPMKTEQAFETIVVKE